jgi:hypothetical protein
MVAHTIRADHCAAPSCLNGGLSGCIRGLGSIASPGKAGTPARLRRRLPRVVETRRKLLSLWLAPPNAFASVADQSEDREGRMIENRNRLLGVLLAAVLVALGVLAYLYYERTKPVAKIDLLIDQA